MPGEGRGRRGDTLGTDGTQVSPWCPQPDARFFRIDLPNSGRVVLARPLDFESRQSLEVVVTAVVRPPGGTPSVPKCPQSVPKVSSTCPQCGPDVPPVCSQHDPNVAPM